MNLIFFFNFFRVISSRSFRRQNSDIRSRKGASPKRCPKLSKKPYVRKNIFLLEVSRGGYRKIRKICTMWRIRIKKLGRLGIRNVFLGRGGQMLFFLVALSLFALFRKALRASALFLNLLLAIALSPILPVCLISVPF